MRITITLILLASIAGAEEENPLVLAGKVVLREPDEAYVRVHILEHRGKIKPQAQLLGADGKFRFEGLRPGAYRIDVWGNNHAHWTDTYFELTQSRRDMVIKLPRPAVLHGSIKTTYEATGKRILIHVYRRDSQWMDEIVPLKELRSKPDGSFRIRLAPGSYRVDFIHESVVHPEHVDLNEGEQSLDVTLAPHAEVDLTLELPPGESRASGQFSFPGTQFGGDEIEVGRGKGDAMWIRRKGQKPRNAGLPIPLLMHGRARPILIEMPGYERVERKITPERDKRTTVRIPLRPLPGQYLALAAKDPRARFWVNARPAKTKGEWKPWPWTQRKGRRAVFVPEGSWTLRLESSDRVDSIFSYTAGADRALRAGKVSLKPGITIRGRLRGPSGRLLEGGQIHVWTKEGNKFSILRSKDVSLWTEPFEIKGLGSGTYRFTFDHDGKVVIATVEIAAKDLTVEWNYPLR